MKLKINEHFEKNKIINLYQNLLFRASPTTLQQCRRAMPYWIFCLFKIYASYTDAPEPKSNTKI